MSWTIELPPMPALEHACYFASWCFVGEFRPYTDHWLSYAFILATDPTDQTEDTSLPRTKA